MLPAEIEKALSLIEMQCQAVADAVASGEPQALEAGSNALRQAAVEFSDFMQRLGGPQRVGAELRPRLQKLATQLTIQRENLIRRSVVVERALHAMLPATRKSTYAQPAAGRAGSYKAFAA